MATPVVEVRVVFTVMDGLAMQICPVRSAFQMRWADSTIFAIILGPYVYPYAPGSWQMDSNETLFAMAKEANVWRAICVDSFFLM